MNLIDFSKDVISISDTGLVRKANEDNCYVTETPNGFLFVVCDGMGGHVGGARASAIAVNSIVKFLSKEHYAAVGQALEDALNFANRQILSVASEYPELKGMGTTACILLLRDDRAYFAHIGDSRIYLYCSRQQKLHRLTKDHSVVQGLVDQGVISEAEAENHPNKNRILKTLGIKKDIQPDICTMPVLPAKDDVFLICSDGLSGMVNDELLQHILEQKVSLQEKGDNMLTFAKQAGGTDNITLQLIHISNSPHANPVFVSKNSPYPVYSDNKRNRSNKLFIALTALFVAVIVCGTLFLLNPFKTGEDAKNIRPANVEAAKEPAWKKLAVSMKHLKDDVQKQERYFQKNRDGNIIDGIIVYRDDSYFVGKFREFTLEDGIQYAAKTGDLYNKDGSLKEKDIKYDY
ncbi:MAG: Stp1/IreP family PP2C-type Ser/Thr phosphatase [Prevotellaceae bacterium]|jgi:protein phosphatase|nr:Stp1/IreP family PP2C-type Ser/Thr phosphatase [Prevotellaceae bacterium]